MGINPATYKLFINSYELHTEDVSLQKLSQGLINDTYIVYLNKYPTYLLQKINRTVFKEVDSIVGNQIKVVEVLKKYNSNYPNLIKTKSGNSFVIDVDDNYWRLSEFVPNSIAHNASKNHTMAFEAGQLLAEFHHVLKEEDPSEYQIPIEKFNDLSFRFEQFDAAHSRAKKDRLEQSRELNVFIQTLKPLLLKHNLRLPTRVCHNDTKLNNLLFTKDTSKAICLIDLDTVMPGYLFYDFGDLFRTAAFSAQEGELELDTIKLNKVYTKALINGFLGKLKLPEEDELKSLALGAVYMPFIHGLRALTDFLSNDIYYKVNYPLENLDRAQSLFRFAKEAYKNNAYINKCIKEFSNFA